MTFPKRQTEITATFHVYNFVAFIDDKWFYINGSGNIPSNLMDNLDEEKYSYACTQDLKHHDFGDRLQFSGIILIPQIVYRSK
jgi:hypothetical protein